MAENTRRQIVLGVVAGGLLLLAVSVATRSRGPAPNGAYFYDLGSSKLYVYRPGVTPPSGGEGVRAAVYACSSCNDPESRFVAYLSRESPPDPEGRTTTEIRAVEGENWLNGSSEAAIALTMEPRKRCPADQPAVVCTP